MEAAGETDPGVISALDEVLQIAGDNAAKFEETLFYLFLAIVAMVLLHVPVTLVARRNVARDLRTLAILRKGFDATRLLRKKKQSSDDISRVPGGKKQQQ